MPRHSSYLRAPLTLSFIFGATYEHPRGLPVSFFLSFFLLFPSFLFGFLFGPQGRLRVPSGASTKPSGAIRGKLFYVFLSFHLSFLFPYFRHFFYGFFWASGLPLGFPLGPFFLSLFSFFLSFFLLDIGLRRGR